MRWPTSEQVADAVGRWAADAQRRTDVEAVGYFGSYARGDWGVGSDLDLLVLVDDGSRLGRTPFDRRGTTFDVSRLPVATDLVVYTTTEFDQIRASSRFGRVVADEIVWVFAPPG